MLKIVENLSAVRVPPRPPLGNSQRSADPLAGWEGFVAPPAVGLRPRFSAFRSNWPLNEKSCACP